MFNRIQAFIFAALISFAQRVEDKIEQIADEDFLEKTAIEYLQKARRRLEGSAERTRAAVAQKHEAAQQRILEADDVLAAARHEHRALLHQAATFTKEAERLTAAASLRASRAEMIASAIS